MGGMDACALKRAAHMYELTVCRLFVRRVSRGRGWVCRAKVRTMWCVGRVGGRTIHYTLRLLWRTDKEILHTKCNFLWMWQHQMLPIPDPFVKITTNNNIISYLEDHNTNPNSSSTLLLDDDDAAPLTNKQRLSTQSHRIIYFWFYGAV